MHLLHSIVFTLSAGQFAQINFHFMIFYSIINFILLFQLIILIYFSIVTLLECYESSLYYCSKSSMKIP